ncbi:hypothetical protein CEXT_428711 [Caerostris extrusa]|uniref:Uncharacterized protein n=1 Tax=Caerostris extrusa TaxID=172846 RepID=A0AAV4N2G3_CAEEX|nr:hypothetical protein CEXT_428711 [Caerostris extrusa]
MQPTCGGKQDQMMKTTAIAGWFHNGRLLREGIKTRMGSHKYSQQQQSESKRETPYKLLNEKGTTRTRDSPTIAKEKKGKLAEC